MFFWWVKITMRATRIANILYKGSFSLKMKSINTMKEIPAKIELNETKRVKYNTNKNTPIQQIATNG